MKSGIKVFLETWMVSLKKKIHALTTAMYDPRVPTISKIIIVIVIYYALSPIDLIPDFIPFFGFLDDLLLLPIGIWFSIQLIPSEVWEECKATTIKDLPEISNRFNIMLIFFILSLWLFVFAGSIWVLWQMVNQVL